MTGPGIGLRAFGRPPADSDRDRAVRPDGPKPGPACVPACARVSWAVSGTRVRMVTFGTPRPRSSEESLSAAAAALRLRLASGARAGSRGTGTPPISHGGVEVCLGRRIICRFKFKFTQLLDRPIISLIWNAVIHHRRRPPGRRPASRRPLCKNNGPATRGW
jgi:hypothetical protein